MKCPLSLRDTVVIDGIECTTRAMDCIPDCAWLMEHKGYGKYCAVAMLAASGMEAIGFHPVNSIERGM